ncbi:MAG: LLM class flavin-dependent oxidoreductase, partial [Deltaproteobacteria bacterium]|nr:LLM class flavin-dependent oxidoreductase [Deltaproteobacteria bacterium]
MLSPVLNLEVSAHEGMVAHHNAISLSAVGDPFPLPGYMFDRRLGKDLYEGYLALYRRADELGFDGICVAEHHSGKTGIDPSPNLMASVLAKQTKQARIVVMGNCLPLHGHPIRLAEELDRQPRKHG